MDKLEIFQEQIKMLEKLIELKNEVIKELEKKLEQEKNKPVVNIIQNESIPYDKLVINTPFIGAPACPHEYDFHSIIPRCKKCGHFQPLVTYGGTISTNVAKED